MKIIADIPNLDDQQTTLVVTPSQTALDKVLFDFNPSGNRKVARIKGLCAALIEEMLGLRCSGSDAQDRTAALAIADLEKVQMLCVKALFAKA